MDYVELMEAVGCPPFATHECPSCERAVRCDIVRGGSHCWCFDVKSQLRDLEMYEACLCKKCLTEHTT